MSLSTPVVFIVDDDASFLKAVARLLRNSGFEVREFSSAGELLTQITCDTIGCVIADLQMPGVNGLELQEKLAKDGNEIPVIFLTCAGDIPSSVRAMRQGAEDFLTKNAPKDELLSAVRRAIDRNAGVQEQRARLRGLREPFQKLSPRERVVLSHVLRGRLNKQIAFELSISERSIKRHRTSLMNKLGVDSVAELINLLHLAEWNFEALKTQDSAS